MRMRVVLLNRATASLVAVLSLFATACTPCGGGGETTPTAEPPVATPSAEAPADGSAAEPRTAVATEIGRLEAIGQLRASVVVGDRVYRATESGELRLDRLVAGGQAQAVWSVQIDNPGEVVDLRGAASGVLVLRVERAASVEQPPTTGSFTWLDTADADAPAPTVPEATDIPGAPSDAWVAPNGDVWVLARLGRQGELLRYTRAGGDWTLTDRVPTEESPVRLEANASGTRLAVPCFDGRTVQVVSVASRSIARTIRVDVRPYTATFAGDDVLLISSVNTAQVRVVDLAHDSDGQISTLPHPMPTWHIADGHAYGAASGSGALVRATLPFAALVSERHDWGQASPVVGGLAMQTGALAVLDVGTPAIRWVDPTSLATLVEVSVPSAPSRWHVDGGDLVVVAHRDGAASRWQLRR